MRLDLRPDDLAAVRQILQTHVAGREVWAFGSRATGCAKTTSDLDLAVIGEEPLDFAVMARLRDAFSESNLPFRVDVTDWATMDESFRGIVRGDHLVLQQGAEATLR